MKRTPLKRKTPMKRQAPLKRAKSVAPRKRIKSASTKRARELKEYREVVRPAFLALHENDICPVMLEGLVDWWNFHATEVHHMAGREGKLLLDTRYFLAVSRAGHEFIHQNPNLARVHGWIIDSNQRKNHVPK